MLLFATKWYKVVTKWYEVEYKTPNTAYGIGTGS